MIKKEIMIDSDIKNVWDAFCKIESWNSYCNEIIEAKWISKEKWKLNSRFTQTIKLFPLIGIFKSNPKFLKIAPFKEAAWKGNRKLICGVHTFKFKKIGKKTKVSNIEYFKGHLAFFILPLIKRRFEKYFENFNQGLKTEAEKNGKI